MELETFNRGLLEFLSRATTPFHAVGEMARQLQSAGYVAIAGDVAWRPQAGGKYFSVANGSSIVAFTAGSETPPEQGFRMIGAHTDSPCLKVKPTPDIHGGKYWQLGVEIYGGVLLNPWFDRDLSLAGRVTLEDGDGNLKNLLVDFREPIAVLPSLAIHLDRKANSERTVNPQTHMPPLLAVSSEDQEHGFDALLEQQLKREHPQVGIRQLLGYEMSFYDSQAPQLLGVNQEFLVSARLDNLLSCYCGLQAMLAASGRHSALLVCNDHEEVGSQSAVGAQGPMVELLLQRLVNNNHEYARAIEQSMMISADNAHAVHPNFKDKHDDNHGPVLNQGPVIKINANQRYASNSETAALFRLLAAREEVALQTFVTRADMACGSTIGPITASNLGVRTVDVGVPQFAMHSIRETAGSQDAHALYKVLRSFVDFEGPLGDT